MKPNSKSKLKIFLLFLSFLFLFLKCDKKEEFFFPYEHVDMQLHVYTDLSDVGAYTGKIYPNEGKGGILIFKIEERKYFAYDLACTYEIPEICKIIEFQKSSIIYECPCCKSQYTISTDGCYVNKNPAKWPLKEYNTYISGDFLYVSN